jgi:hypothetical protein
MDFSALWNKLSGGVRIAAVAGLVLIINLFLPWYGIAGFNINAFDSGFLAWFGSILAIAGAVIVVLGALGRSKISFGSLQGGQIALLVGGLGALFVILRWLTETSLVKFGLFLGIAAAIGVTAGAYLDLKESGVGMPTADDFKRFTGGGGGDAPPPPPPPA